MKNPAQCIEKIEAAHRQTLRSLAAFHRANAGATTARKHWETYERAEAKFEYKVEELREHYKEKGQ